MISFTVACTDAGFYGNLRISPPMSDLPCFGLKSCSCWAWVHDRLRVRVPSCTCVLPCILTWQLDRCGLLRDPWDCSFGPDLPCFGPRSWSCQALGRPGLSSLSAVLCLRTSYIFLSATGTDAGFCGTPGIAPVCLFLHVLGLGLGHVGPWTCVHLRSH